MNEQKEQKCVCGTTSFEDKLNKLFAEGWRIVPGTVAGDWKEGFCAVVERPIPAPTK